jgi:hypothetical protein
MNYTLMISTSALYKIKFEYMYKYYVFGHYPLPCPYLKCLASLSKHNFSETGFCLRLQVKPTRGPIDRASPYFR